MQQEHTVDNFTFTYINESSRELTRARLTRAEYLNFCKKSFKYIYKQKMFTRFFSYSSKCLSITRIWPARDMGLSNCDPDTVDTLHVNCRVTQRGYQGERGAWVVLRQDWRTTITLRIDEHNIFMNIRQVALDVSLSN